MREQEIQRKILKRLQDRGAKTIKIVKATTNGEPDIVCCYKGRFYGIEVKAEKGKPMPLQLKKLKDIIKAGGIAFICRDIETLDYFLDNPSKKDCKRRLKNETKAITNARKIR